MLENYPKAYTEVIEILKFMPKESLNKIPKDVLNVFYENRDKDYTFHINLNDDFSKLNIMKETEAIFVNIFKDYWATPEQREKLIAKQADDIKKIEEKKKKEYDIQNIFNKKKEYNFKNNFSENNITTNLPEKYKESIFKKFTMFIKKMLGI